MTQAINFTQRWRERAPEPLEVHLYGEVYQVSPQLPAMVTAIAADVNRLQAQDRSTLTTEEQFAVGEAVMQAFTTVLDAVFAPGATARWIAAGATVEELRDLFFWVCAGFRFVDPPAPGNEVAAPLAETGETPPTSPSTTSSTDG